MTVVAPIDNLGYPKENQQPPLSEGHLHHPLANEGEDKINKWMNIWTLNKSKVLLYQMQVPLNFLLPIFFPLGSGDDGDWGGWSTGGSELSWTGTMKRSNGWQFECLFLCLVDK